MSRNLARLSNRQLTITSLALLVGLSVSSGSDAALSATTANTIKGTAPLFVTTGANAVNLTDFKYFGLHYNGTDYYTPLQLGAALDAAGANGGTTKPSDLYNGGGATTYPLTLALGTPLSAEINDVDGDGVNPAPITELTTGSVQLLGWYYGAGAGTQLTGADLNKSFCVLAAANKAPYLKITGDINLNTTYGDPNSQPYPDTALGLTTPIRKFSIPLSGGVCGALPDKKYNMGFYIGAPEWDTTLGFLPQPAGSDNFPTTGADGLYFDLIIGGVDATTLKWPGFNVGYNALTHNGIKVEVTAVTATNVRVKLTGPKASTVANGGTATTPIGGVGFTSPASFTVQGLQGTTPVISYPFNIKRWYIHREDVAAPAVTGNYTYPATHAKYPGWVVNNQQDWCSNLSGPDYVLPAVNELTNAQGNAVGSGGGVIPLSPFPNTNNTNNYQRRIGGGLFTEWGYMSNYTGAGFVNNNHYWTTDINGTFQFRVNSSDGRVGSIAPSDRHYAVCASRP